MEKFQGVERDRRARGQPGIQDYAVIGDCRSAALVSKEGSVDWLCWPRFDSPSLFGALLDAERGGFFRIAPPGPSVILRRYLPQSNVLETTFDTADGRFSVQDAMPVASEEEKARRLFPDHELLRVVTCEEGAVEVEVEFRPRPGYGLREARLRDRGPLGIVGRAGFGLFSLRSLPAGCLRLPDRGRACGRLRLRAGERAVFSLTYSQEAPAILSPLELAEASIRRTAAWWRDWAAAIQYEGPYRSWVVRSALALRMLIYAPSGAVVAAPTTSLPEEPGGRKNWDYRYCWLRDASFTVRALFGLGYRDEAQAFMSWLLHTTRLTRPRLNVLYDVFGERTGGERELPLEGYLGAKPVRVGNGAEDQLQLDVYGEVIDAACQSIFHGGSLDRETAGMLAGFGEYVCRNWQRPDEGIWEVRSGRVYHTHSRVLCWTSLERLIELHRKGHLHERTPVQRFKEVRDRIRREVEEKGWNQELQSYVNVYGTDHVDAVSLLFPWYGYEDASSPRMRSTFERIHERLSAGNGLYYRYLTQNGDKEGAFGLCSFWAAEYLARGGGTLAEARRLFEKLLRYGNDLGLFGEEVDPSTGAALGNFHQGFTHVGLINAALAINERMQGQRQMLHHVLPRADGRRGRQEAQRPPPEAASRSAQPAWAEASRGRQPPEEPRP